MDTMDDGSLAFLNIPADASSKRFNCEPSNIKAKI